MSEFPQWCLLCASVAHDNGCGHFSGPIPDHAMPKDGTR